MEPETAYDLVADEYDKAHSSPVIEAENRWLVRQLRSGGFLHNGTGGLTLDVGCGTGLLHDLADPDERPHVMGLDISHNMVAIARRKHPEAMFVVEDMDDLSVEPVDAITALFGPFNYAADPEAFIDGAWRSLKPGGRIFILAYSPAHTRRPSVHYLVGDRGLNPTRTIYDSSTLWGLFALSGRWKDVEVRGFSGPTAYLAEYRLPARALDLIVASESALRKPDECFYLVLTAEKKT